MDATGDGLLPRVVPEFVSTGESIDPVRDAVSLPAELQAIARAVPQRRTEFLTVRYHARAALGRIGVEPVAILNDADRAPSWPAGCVGSLTHCPGFYGAAVARSVEVRSVGIDAEPNERLTTGLLAEITSGEERVHLDQLPIGDIAWDRLLFSAKEAIYKAWYPLAQRWLDYTGAVVTIDPHSRTFRGRVLAPAPLIGNTRLDVFTGRWTTGAGVLVTGVTVIRE